jgi:hypothetical protein
MLGNIDQLLTQKWVKLVFENTNTVSEKNRDKADVIQTIIKSYKKILNNDQLLFSLVEEYQKDDDLLLVIHHRVPKEVKNRDELTRYRDIIKAKVPGTNMNYAGKVHKLKIITGNPVMIMVLLEHEIDGVPTQEVVIPTFLNAGKI